MFFGFILSSLSQNNNNNNPHPTLTSPTHFLQRILIPTILLPAGLYLCSYPGENAEWTPWSKQLHTLSTYIFPSTAENIPRFFTAIGLDLCLIAIHLSPSLKRVLSSKPFLWLGRHSFAVYLIHGTLLRTLLTMAFYGWKVTGDLPVEEWAKNESGDPIPPYMHLLPLWHRAFWLPPWVALVYYCAYLWTTYVDAWCARMTKKLEAYVFDDSEKFGLGPLLS